MQYDMQVSTRLLRPRVHLRWGARRMHHLVDYIARHAALREPRCGGWVGPNGLQSSSPMMRARQHSQVEGGGARQGKHMYDTPSQHPSKFSCLDTCKFKICIKQGSPIHATWTASSRVHPFTPSGQHQARFIHSRHMDSYPSQ